MSNREESIQKFLTGKFSLLEGHVRIQRDRRIYADCPKENLEEIFKYVMKELDFTYLCTITGLDEGGNLSFIYHLTRPDGVMLSLKISVPRATPVIKSVLDYFANAEIYEREVVDLLGAKVEGLPEGRRYPLPDDWPKDQHPLRKDWKKEQKQNA